MTAKDEANRYAMDLRGRVKPAIYRAFLDGYETATKHNNPDKCNHSPTLMMRSIADFEIRCKLCHSLLEAAEWRAVNEIRKVPNMSDRTYRRFNAREKT